LSKVASVTFSTMKYLVFQGFVGSGKAQNRPSSA